MAKGRTPKGITAKCFIPIASLNRLTRRTSGKKKKQAPVKRKTPSKKKTPAAKKRKQQRKKKKPASNSDSA